MGKHRIAWIAAFALAVVGLQAPAVAAADTDLSTDTGTDIATSPAEHCVVGLAEESSKSAGDPVIDYRCFDSLTESLDYVVDEAAQVTDARVEAATLVGVLYNETGYGSSTLALYGSGGSCSSGANYGFPHLGNYGWNNRAESAKGRNGCDITFYAGADYTSDTKSCFSSCSTLGGLNNRATSVYFW